MPCCQPRREEEGREAEDKAKDLDILYKVNDRPPVVLLLVLAFQQFLTMFGATFSFPIFMSKYLCLDGDAVGLSHHIGTVIFVAGLATLIQSTIGIRLPIIQSVSFAYVTPFIVLLTLPRWTCPTCVKEPDGMNITCGSDEHVDVWQARMRELQGAVMVSSVLQMLIGFTGLIGLLLRFVGPLTIAPTIAMIGLGLFDSVYAKAEGQWWIALTVVALIAIFSQYLRRVNIPFCGRRPGRGCVRTRQPIFSLFPVLFAVGLIWILCYILTVTDVFPPSSDQWGYRARTDTQGDVIAQADWFQFPYPGQWGVPTVSVAGVLGGCAAVLASIVESLGDYYACARLSGAPPPPESAVNRGIGMEGVTGLLAGAWGSGAGTTSYSENIGAIGITKVGSRAVVQVSGVLMMVLGCIGKFSAVFVTIPDPIVGGLFMAMFGMVIAVGISNLQFVNLNSSRNLFILGISVVLGLSLPKWLALPANANAIDTGNTDVDNILSVLCKTSMFVAGVVAFVLDNTMPGSYEERGLNWREGRDEDGSDGTEARTYDLPWVQGWLDRRRCSRFVPCLPGFRGEPRPHKPPADGHANDGFDTQL